MTPFSAKVWGALHHERSLRWVNAHPLRDAASDWIDSPDFRIEISPERFGFQQMPLPSVGPIAEMAERLRSSRNDVVALADGFTAEIALLTEEVSGGARVVTFFDESEKFISGTFTLGKGYFHEHESEFLLAWQALQHRGCSEDALEASRDGDAPAWRTEPGIDSRHPFFETLRGLGSKKIDQIRQSLLNCSLDDWLSENHLSESDPYFAGAPATLLVAADQIRETEGLPSHRPGEVECLLIGCVLSLN